MKDVDGKKVVMIHDVIFRNRQNISWDEVEKYLHRYIGEVYEVLEYHEAIYIGKDLPNEYAGSKYTRKLKGTGAKAKANAAQGIPEIISIASKKRYKENLNNKHREDAKYGWYRYDSRFAIPNYSNEGEIEKYNVFRVEILVRHASDGKLYLYDIINLKKEPGNPLKQ